MEHADEVVGRDVEADLFLRLPDDRGLRVLARLDPAADEAPAPVIGPFDQQQPALIVDDGGVGADLRGDAADLLGEAGHDHRAVDRAHLGVGLRRQVDQALVALPVERIVGEVEAGPTDGL